MRAVATARPRSPQRPRSTRDDHLAGADAPRRRAPRRRARGAARGREQHLVLAARRLALRAVGDDDRPAARWRATARSFAAGRKRRRRRARAGRSPRRASSRSAAPGSGPARDGARAGESGRPSARAPASSRRSSVPRRSRGSGAAALITPAGRCASAVPGPPRLRVDPEGEVAVARDARRRRQASDDALAARAATTRPGRRSACPRGTERYAARRSSALRRREGLAAQVDAQRRRGPPGARAAMTTRDEPSIARLADPCLEVDRRMRSTGSAPAARARTRRDRRRRRRGEQRATGVPARPPSPA